MTSMKRYICKNDILSNINKLDRLFDADALILDMWSSKFKNNLNKDHIKIRNKIKKDISTSSDINISTHHENFKLLNSLSESLIFLKTDPNWIDINFVNQKLNINIQIIDNFDDIKNKCIQKIIEYHDK